MGRPREIGFQIGDGTKLGRPSRPTLDSTRVRGRLRRPSVRVQRRASPRPPSVRRFGSTGALPHGVPVVVQNSRGRSSGGGRVPSPSPHAADSPERPSRATRVTKATGHIVDGRGRVRPRALGDAVARPPTLASARTSLYAHCRDARWTRRPPFRLPPAAVPPSSDFGRPGSSGPRRDAGMDGGAPTDAHGQVFRPHARPTVDRSPSVSPTPMGSEVSYLTEPMRCGCRPSSTGVVCRSVGHERDACILGVDPVVAATNDGHLSDADSFQPLEEDACSLDAAFPRTASVCPGLAPSEARPAGEADPRVESLGNERSDDADEGWKRFLFGDEGSDDAGVVR